MDIYRNMKSRIMNRAELFYGDMIDGRFVRRLNRFRRRSVEIV